MMVLPNINKKYGRTAADSYPDCFILFFLCTLKVSPSFFSLYTGDREKFSLPDDMPIIHFEYTQFYYPGDIDFPRKN